MHELLIMVPDFYPALVRMAKYRWLFHDSPAEALSFIERVIELEPMNPWARNVAVAFYFDLDDKEAASNVAEGAHAG